MLVQTTTKLRSCRTVCTARQYFVCILLAYHSFFSCQYKLSHSTSETISHLSPDFLPMLCLALMGYSGARKHQLLQYTIIKSPSKVGDFLQDSMQSTLLSFSTNVRTQCSASLLCFAQSCPEFRPLTLCLSEVKPRPMKTIYNLDLLSIALMRVSDGTDLFFAKGVANLCLG